MPRASFLEMPQKVAARVRKPWGGVLFLLGKYLVSYCQLWSLIRHPPQCT